MAARMIVRSSGYLFLTLEVAELGTAGLIGAAKISHAAPISLPSQSNMINISSNIPTISLKKSNGRVVQ